MISRLLKKSSEGPASGHGFRRAETHSLSFPLFCIGTSSAAGLKACPDEAPNRLFQQPVRRPAQAWLAVLLLALGAAFLPVLGAAEEASFPPVAQGERLALRLLWPSGVSLGEAILRATPSGNRLRLELTVEATMPQSNINDAFVSVVQAEDLCSLLLQQKIQEGTRTLEERVEFDPQSGQAVRTIGGRTETLSLAPCARDPLALFYYFRRELAAGRTPTSGKFFFGRNFSLRIEAAGEETVTAGGARLPSEKFVLTYSAADTASPNPSSMTFEFWIAKDPARRLLRLSLPLALGTFAAELE